jgi:alanine dehydrogenase
MPGAVARTATQALTNATLPYVVQLANKGIVEALLANEHLLQGLNVHAGLVTYDAVAEALGYDCVAPREALERALLKASA